MKLITPCLLGAIAFATAASADPIVDIQTMKNGDGTWTHWISIDPNSGLSENTFIDTTIKADQDRPDGYLSKIHQYLNRENYQEVHLTSQQGNAVVNDPTYPYEIDTVFDDGDWPGVVGVQIVTLNTGLGYVPPPAPQPSLNGNRMMSVQAASFTGGVGGPIPSGELTPIWHVTTWGPWLWVYGELQTDSNPHATFSAHVPEPSSALLAGLGLALMGVVRRRR